MAVSWVLPPPTLTKASGFESLARRIASSRVWTGEWGATPENRPTHRSLRASWTRWTTLDFSKMDGPQTTIARVLPSRSRIPGRLLMASSAQTTS